MNNVIGTETRSKPLDFITQESIATFACNVLGGFDITPTPLKLIL